MRPQRSEKGFLSLVGILLTLVIISILVYISLTTYFKKPVTDQKTERSLSEQGIDASSQKAVLDSVRTSLEESNKKVLDREKQLEKLW